MNGERDKPIRQEDNLHPEGKYLEVHAQVHLYNFNFSNNTKPKPSR